LHTREGFLITGSGFKSSRFRSCEKTNIEFGIINVESSRGGQVRHSIQLKK
jgi:hypothetical protein